MHLNYSSCGPEQLGKYCIAYPIELAASQGSKELVEYLISRGHLIPSSQPLFSAINANNTEIMKILINAGANVTQCRLNRDIWRYHLGEAKLEQFPAILCPLVEAIQNNKVDAAKLLLESGASLNDLSYVNPFNPNVNKAEQKTVTQLIDENKDLKLSDEMKNMLSEFQVLNDMKKLSMS